MATGSRKCTGLQLSVIASIATGALSPCSLFSKKHLLASELCAYTKSIRVLISHYAVVWLEDVHSGDFPERSEIINEAVNIKNVRCPYLAGVAFADRFYQHSSLRGKNSQGRRLSSLHNPLLICMSVTGHKLRFS